ncbi:unnamed protein product [Microthlaspi erraticum]|uniref:Uncharacterized protein n=1 Tax=Microthlaspi erraticum TaxID=1685480 RepID=A0A6D2I848_9BRAS|nr:unnamed protein product [Microthlaspi erraticum]CAA7024747.1 unnamed protein product [Microthlaspi erraticum]
MKMRNSPFHGAGGYTGFRASNFTFKKAVKKVMRDRSNNQFMVQMENMVRRIFREEFDRRIQPYLSSSWAQMEQPRSETSSSRSRYKLRFINSPPPSIFTGGKIETEDESPVAIELIDVTTNARVVSGPLASSRLEIVPLNADFTEENWNVDGFKRNILKSREGKRPLLTGDLTVTLKDGVGVIAGDVSFSDNSSWTRSRKFRLGARLTGGGAVEARSEAFGCKDQRGVPYRKHHPPYPSDEVWRLEKIAKDGVSATRLGEQNIYTVKDFRRLYAIAPNELYSILGVGISKRTWEAIVSHAMRCVLDETECYIYNANAHGVSLLFNSVYEVIKVYFGDGTVVNPDQLPIYQLEQLKREAYLNLNRFRPFTGLHPQRSLQCTQDPGFGVACPALQHIDFQGNSGPSDSSMSTVYFKTASSTVQPEMVMSFENSPTATFHMDEKLLQSLRNSFGHDPVHGESSRTEETRGYVENEEDGVHENNLAYQDHHETRSNWSPGAADWEQQMYNLYVSVSGTEEAGTYDVRFGNGAGSPRGRWCKVKAAFKLREVWRHTNAKRRGKSCKKPCLPY